MASVHYEKITPRDLRDRLDVQTRASIGLSAEEFMARSRRQALDMTSPVVSRLALIARLLDHADTDKS